MEIEEMRLAQLAIAYVEAMNSGDNDRLLEISDYALDEYGPTVFGEAVDIARDIVASR